MKILTVSAFYECHGGGIEIVAGATARALARRGHDCRWAAAGFDPPPEDRSIKSAPFAASDPLERWTGLPMPLPARAARRQLAKEVAAADAIIIHDALYVSSLLAAHYARRCRKPWILVQHIGMIPYINPLPRFALSCANRLVTTRLLAQAPQAVFISDAVRRFFDRGLKSAPAILFNGLDHSLFRPPAGDERAELRAHHRIAEGRRQLLFVGRFVEKKGLLALREFAAANLESDVLMVGSGPIDPHAWGLPNIRLLGRRDRDEIAELYRVADALLLPSVGEGFPLVVQEAMASGLPVFCGLDSAAADPKATALVHPVRVDPADPRATARRFAAAIATATLGPDVKIAAYARDAYDWDANARWIEARFEELRREARTRDVTASAGAVPAI
jgi:glycosyltransferase involved in cell wall biosynthesis